MSVKTTASKKSLTIVVPELLPVPPVKGGAVEHWVQEVTSRLDQDLFEISIVSRPSGQINDSHIEYIGVPWTPIEKLFHWIKERVSWRNPLRYIAKIQNVSSYGLRVAKIVKNTDVVVIHNEPNLLLFVRKQPQQKLVLHMHNEHLTHPAFRYLYRRALNKADLVICVSEYIKSTAVKYFPEHAHKFLVVFNATDPEVFKPYGAMAKQQIRDIVKFEPENTYLLYVGRLTQEKGVDVLIKAFSIVNQKLSNTKLVIAGSSFFEGAAKTIYERELIKLAAPVSHSIVFTGFIPHQQLKYLYSAVDIVALPSVWQDPCPLVVLEAMASGTCIVATRVGGVPEVVSDGDCGLLVSPNHAEELAHSILTVLSDKATKSAIEAKARQKIEAAYAWEHLVDKLTKTLLHLHHSTQTIARGEL